MIRLFKASVLLCKPQGGHGKLIRIYFSTSQLQTCSLLTTICHRAEPHCLSVMEGCTPSNMACALPWIFILSSYYILWAKFGWGVKGLGEERCWSSSGVAGTVTFLGPRELVRYTQESELKPKLSGHIHTGGLGTAGDSWGQLGFWKHSKQQLPLKMQQLHTVHWHPGCHSSS